MGDEEKRKAGGAEKPEKTRDDDPSVEEGLEREEIELEIAIPREAKTPTDGKWGWFVVFNSFICNMIVDGMQYTFANFLMPIAMTFNASVTQAALIGSLLSGFYNFSGPIASAMGNKFGFRMVAITGSLVSASGLAASYFAPNIEYLYFVYGIIGGLGFGMIYMSSVIMTSMYFEKYRALAASISVCGTGIGTFVFSPLGTFLVSNYGWRWALVFEGALTLVCIFCGLSFKPIDIMTVAPVIPKTEKLPLSASEASLRTTTTTATTGVRRGSFVYPLERRKTFNNEAYPTLKEVLLQEEKIDSVLSKSIAPSRRSTINDILESMDTKDDVASIIVPVSYLGEKRTFTPSEEPISGKTTCKTCCANCCYNFWHCSCGEKKKELNLGDRPLYRDDIFYDQTLTELRFSSSDKLRYHLSIMRIPDLKELEQHRRRKCCTCHQAVVRTCVTMLGLNLLKSKIFNFLCISSFAYTMGLYIPYVFIKNFASEHDINESISMWLVSAIGISNTAGRLASGIFKSLVKINASLLVLICLLLSGLYSFIFLVCQNIFCLVSYSCVFGFFTAPFISLRPVIIVEFLGIEKLTNAFGLVLLSQGIASILGPPLAGLIVYNTGQSAYVLYLSGTLMVFSALSLLVSTLFSLRKKK